MFGGPKIIQNWVDPRPSKISVIIWKENSWIKTDFIWPYLSIRTIQVLDNNNTTSFHKE